jgi:2',3'-cyclic-nucleotide 2'-phosphodiesterase (5'-nucleotidase family)
MLLQEHGSPRLRLLGRAALAVGISLGTGCAAGSFEPTKRDAASGTALESGSSATEGNAAARRERVITIVGTNDLHGHVEALPLLAGYVEALRAARARDGGAVLVVDAGDMFQGTLESNLVEGASVVDAFAAMGVTAVTVGNHEYDYGPVGEAATPSQPSDDPRGALKALAARAPFPFLLANTTERASGNRVAWPNMPASVIVEAAGVKVGLVGVSTRDTLTTTIAANVSDLAMAPLAPTIEREARSLRERGASLVVALAHAGGECARFSGRFEEDGCVPDAEIVEVARALPSGLVDLVVAGHTHAGMAHEIGGTAVVEAYSYGRAFDRVDLVVAGDPPRLVRREIAPPRDLCPGSTRPDLATCEPPAYEGAPVIRSEAVAHALAPAIASTRAKREERLGPTLTAPVTRDYDDESPLGNLFADLLRRGTKADVALMNGGGLRADLPAGPLTFGALYEAFPFDNRVAQVTLEASTLEALVRAHLERGGGILSFSGIDVVARCDRSRLDVVLSRAQKRLAPETKLTVAGSDFLFLGGDDFWGPVPPPNNVRVEERRVRDVLASALREEKSLAPEALYVPARPRLSMPTRRPLRCPSER